MNCSTGILHFSKIQECISSQEGPLQKTLNDFFLVTMGIFIFSMQCGFAMLEAGSIRSKNVTNILLQNLLDSCISSLSYWALGWGLAYGADVGGVIGSSQFLLLGVEPDVYATWFFQFTFVATGATIVSGALAERCVFTAYFAYCSAIAGVAYPIITHWCWHPEGWLAKLHFQDFAGSAVVHLHGGICALVGAAMLGPRAGRFSRPAIDMSGHSVPMTMAGAFLLMFGFLAFNGGSRGSIAGAGDGATVARAITNTILCGAAATLAVLLAYRRWRPGGTRWSILGPINAMLTGMVAACAGCDAYEPWAAVIVGLGAAVVYMSSSWLVAKLGIDDPVDAVAVHAGGGLWGVMAAPILSRPAGVVWQISELSAWRGLGVNLLGSVVIVGWSVAVLGAVFLLLRLCGQLQSPEEAQHLG